MIACYKKNNSRKSPLRCLAPMAVLCLFAWAPSVGAFDESDRALVELLHPAHTEHITQAEINAAVAGMSQSDSFDLVFDAGDELFEVHWNRPDGGGANVQEHQLFTRVPRADLFGPGEWANHFPKRATGPNSQTCISCHNKHVPNGAGEASSNVHRNPFLNGSYGDLDKMIVRNTPMLFGVGPIQVLAEEMPERLHTIRDNAIRRACNTGNTQNRDLKAKGVSFGKIKVKSSGGTPCRFAVDTSKVKGVDTDLVIKPFQWKGENAAVRFFKQGAFHNELGVQPKEIAGPGVDGDHDGVVDEAGYGDLTAMSIYLAGQPRPVTSAELAANGFIPALTPEEATAIRRGKRAFREAGCVDCHQPALKIVDPVFFEPSQNPNYRDAEFADPVIGGPGIDPTTVGVDPTTAVSFNMTTQIKDNPTGGLGNLEINPAGRAIVRLYGDLKRHDLGDKVAEDIDEIGTGASVFLTKELWGVGDTAPYMHDGQSTTLTEAILKHGGDAASSRDAFDGFGDTKKGNLIAFLNSLKILLEGESVFE